MFLLELLEVIFEISGPVSYAVFGPGATEGICQWTLFQKGSFVAQLPKQPL